MEKKYYVYLHQHPITNEVKYVGKGTAGRAWSCGYSVAKADRGIRGNRTEAHQEWLQSLILSGFTPADWVCIIAQGLTNEDAFSIEKETIQKYSIDDLFNISPQDHRGLSLTVSDLNLIKSLRIDGVSYEGIGKIVNRSTMTVYRALNNKTNGYQL